jgi:tRNA(fMet)-specific endonuclease VapC
LVTLSLDTNVLVDLVRGRNPALRSRYHEAEIAYRTMVVSLIAVHELRFGAEFHPEPNLERQRVDAVLGDLIVQPFDEDDIAAVTNLRARLRRRGLPIGPYDLLIAGQALAKGWTVVTANKREFHRVEGLNVIDWTAPAD